MFSGDALEHVDCAIHNLEKQVLLMLMTMMMMMMITMMIMVEIKRVLRIL